MLWCHAVGDKSCFGLRLIFSCQKFRMAEAVFQPAKLLTVLHLEAQVEAGRKKGKIGKFTAIAVFPIESIDCIGCFCTVDHVRHDSGCGWKFAGTFAVEQNFTGCVSGDQNAIEHIIHGGELAFLRNKHRCDHHGNFLGLLVAGGFADQFDDTAPVLCVFHIFGCNFGDAFAGDPLRIDLFAVCKGS